MLRQQLNYYTAVPTVPILFPLFLLFQVSYYSVPSVSILFL